MVPSDIAAVFRSQEFRFSFLEVIFPDDTVLIIDFLVILYKMPVITRLTLM